MKIIILILSSFSIFSYPLSIESDLYTKQEEKKLINLFIKKIKKNPCLKNDKIVNFNFTRNIKISFKEFYCSKDRLLYSSTVKDNVNKTIEQSNLNEFNKKLNSYGEKYIKLLNNKNLRLSKITYLTRSEILNKETIYIYAAKLTYKTHIGKLNPMGKEFEVSMLISPKGNLIEIDFGKLKIEEAKINYRKKFSLTSVKEKMDKEIKKLYSDKKLTYKSRLNYIFKNSKLLLSLQIHLKNGIKEKLFSLSYEKFKKLTKN